MEYRTAEPVNKKRRSDMNETSKFSDLEGAEQEWVLEQKNIIFQGNETNLKELLAPLAKLDLDDIIDSHVLMKLCKNEKIIVGRELNPLDETVGKCCIPRLIRKLDTLPVNCEIFPEKKLSEFDIFDDDDDKVIVLGGSAGSGKTTLLTNLADVIKKERPNLWVVKIDLGNYLKSFNEFKENNFKTVTLEDILNSKPESKLENNFEKKVFSLSDKVILMLDGIDEVCLDYKDILLSILGNCISRRKSGHFEKRPTYLLVLAASMNVYQELEWELSHTLEPFTEKEQVDLLTKYWEQKLQLNDSKREKCRLFAKMVIEEKWLQGKGIENVVGIPLVIQMIAEILEKNENFDDEVSEWEGCYNFLNSTNIKPLLPKKLGLVELYQLFIYKNCFRGTKIGLNLLRDAISKINIECNGYLHIVALETVLTKKTCDYFNCYKTRTAAIPEDKLLSFRILKKVGHEFQFTHRTFAEYFIAESILIELSEPKNEEFLTFFFKEALITDRFNLVRMFIDNFIQTGLNNLQEESLKVIGRSLKQADSSLLLYISAKEGSLGILTFLFKCFEVANIPVDINSVRVKGDLPLHSALGGGYLQVVQFLIERGVQIDTRDKNDSTTLHLAAETGSLAMVKFLVEHRVDVNCKDGKGRTPLHVAAKNGCLEMVKYLLMHGADVNGRTKDGFTALHIATWIGDLDKVKYLVENGANINCRGEQRGMVISTAVASGNISIVKYLVEKGADVTVRSNRGGTMLHLLPEWNINACLRKIMELSKFLVDNGVDINGVDNFGDTVLDLAIKRKYEVEFIKFLVEQGANVHLINHFDNTPLTMAISRGDLKIVEYLMDNGAEFNVHQNQNEVLCDAIRCNRFDVVKHLGERGVSLDTVSEFGISTLDRAVYNNDLDMAKLLVENGVKVDGVSLIRNALSSCNLDMMKFLVENGTETDVDFGKVTSNGDLDSVKFLMEKGSSFEFFEDVGGNLELLQFLFDKGINVDETKIFFKAICDGDLSIIKYLVENGFDVNTRDEYESTALHEAAERNHVSVLSYLLEHGADVNIKDTCGRTPPFVAAAHGCLEAVKLLIGKGADVSSISMGHMTALSEAVQGNFIDTAKFLVEHGAQFNVANEFSDTPLCSAFMCGNLEMAEYLLEKDPDFKCKMEQLVKRLATTDAEPKEDCQLLEGIFSRLETVRHLIEKGVEISSREINKYKLLINAAKDGDFKLVKYFIGRGGDVNNRDYSGRTALHETTDLNMAQLLVQNGADVNVKSREGRSVLRNAIEKSNLDMCKFLIESGANVNEEDAEGRTLLHMKVWSYESISIDKFKYLLEKGAKLKVAKDGCSVLHVMASTHTDLDFVRCIIKAGGDVNCRDKNGHTPLHEAVTAGDLEMVKLLIEDGAEIDTKNSAGTKGVLVRAIESNDHNTYGGKSDLDMLKFLVQKGAKVTATEESGRTLLHKAVSERNIEIVKFLVDNGADVNAIDKNGNSVLSEACGINYFFLIKYLVEKGASFDAKTSKGRTVLHEAAASGCFAAVKFFVENGVDVNVRDKEGNTPLYEAARSKNLWCRANELLNIVKLLIEHGATVDVKTRNGRTPLHEAASNCELHQLKILVVNGADVNAKDEYGRTPLFAAVMASGGGRMFMAGNSDKDVIAFLVESGANLGHQADNGRTALHEASILGNLCPVKHLVEMGANVNAKTGGGRTPLHDAARKGMLNVVKFLVKNGADVDAKTTQNKTALDEATKGEHTKVIAFFRKGKTEV